MLCPAPLLLAGHVQLGTGQRLLLRVPVRLGWALASADKQPAPEGPGAAGTRGRAGRGGYLWEEVGLAAVPRSLQRAGMAHAAPLGQLGWHCPGHWRRRAPLRPSFAGWLAGCAPAAGRARHRMAWDSAPAPRLRLPALGRLPVPCGAAGCPERDCSRRWHRAVLQGAAAGSAFCEPQLVSQRQGTSVCSQIPPRIFVAAKSRKLLARWLPMGAWQAPREPVPGRL